MKFNSLTIFFCLHPKVSAYFSMMHSEINRKGILDVPDDSFMFSISKIINVRKQAHV